MKSKVVHLSIAAASVALMLAACGGGGGGSNAGDSGGSAPALQVSGTAATGAALAGAEVQVKCGTGSGTATTTTSGSYTVSMTGGALPCIVQVTGTTADGASVTLHSVVESGTASGSDTAAVANVTPITEMIVAQLMAALPGDAFASFDAQKVTQTAITSAVTVIVDALKTAGVDLGGIDPLKATLVPATGSTAGNTYDQLLDQLGQTVTPEALPLLVTQIATAAASDTSGGLADAMTAVSGGTLENCPAALSGKYRTVDYYGRTVVREVDFKNRKFMSGNGVDSFDITVDPAKPCEFVASGTVAGTTSEFHVAIGPNGVGAYRAFNTAPSVTVGVTGYIFPVQTHDVAALAGNWTFLQSGFDPAEGHIHWMGDAVFSGNAAELCDFDKAAGWGCDPASKTSLAFAARSDGGFDVLEGGTAVAQIFGYRAPNGSFTVFGTTNATGSTASDVEQTSLVFTRRASLPLRAVGSVSTAWDVDLVMRSTGRVTVNPTATSNTVISNDPSTGAVTRRRDSDCRVDTMMYNQPIAGLIMRDQPDFVNCAGSTVPMTAVYVMPLAGLGITVAISQQQGGFTFTTPHVYSIGLQRP